MHKVNRDIGLKKKRKKEHLHENFDILLLLLLFCFVFVFFLLFVTIIIFLFLCVCGQLTGRAHNEVKQNEAECSMMKLGILVTKRKGCASVSSRSFKCGEQEKKERAFHSFAHPRVIPCCASSQ